MKTVVLGSLALLLQQQGTNAFVATSSRGAQGTELNVERSRRDAAKTSFFTLVAAAGLPTSATAEIDQVRARASLAIVPNTSTRFLSHLSFSLHPHGLQFSLPSYEQSKGGTLHLRCLFCTLESLTFCIISRRNEVNRPDRRGFNREQENHGDCQN